MFNEYTCLCMLKIFLNLQRRYIYELYARAHAQFFHERSYYTVNVVHVLKFSKTKIQLKVISLTLPHTPALNPSLVVNNRTYYKSRWYETKRRFFLKKYRGIL